MITVTEWASRIVPWLVVGLVAIGAGAVPLYVSRARHTSRAHAAAWTAQDALVVAALMSILAFTVGPGSALDGDPSVSLRPFSDLLRVFDLSRLLVGITVGNLVGNVLLFMPLGVALALRYRGLGMLAAVALGAGLSFAIEAWQALSGIGRNADVVDVLMNSLGVAIGYLVMRTLGPIPPEFVGGTHTPNRAR